VNLNACSYARGFSSCLAKRFEQSGGVEWIGEGGEGGGGIIFERDNGIGKINKKNCCYVVKACFLNP
jgi:hypothetical protein